MLYKGYVMPLHHFRLLVWKITRIFLDECNLGFRTVSCILINTI